MSSFSMLLQGLRADDPALRLDTLLRLEKTVFTSEQAQELAKIAELESDPAVRLFLEWALQREKAGKPAELKEIENIVNAGQPDWVRIFFEIYRYPRPRELLDIVRRIDAAKIPDGLFPMLVRFFAEHGTNQDTALLEKASKSKEIGVLTWAVEGLSRLAPQLLRQRLIELLCSSSPGIRSKAVRLLFKFYPDEALRHFNAMMNSEEPAERRAAMADAFLLPWSQVKKVVLRRLYQEKDEYLINLAGNLLITNPDAEAAVNFAAIIVQRRAENDPVFRQIFSRQLEFLSRAGLIDKSGKDLEENLLDRARKKLIEHLKTDSSAFDEKSKELLKFGISLNLVKAGKHDFLSASPAIEKEFVQFSLPLKLGIIERRIEFSVPMTAQWLKNLLASPGETEVYVAAIKGLAALEPEFLLPHLSRLLRHSDSRVQIAALSALARLDPGRAEKLLDQYLFATGAERRIAGYKILVLLEKSFVEPVFVRAFSRETDEKVLEAAASLFLKEPEQWLIDSLVGVCNSIVHRQLLRRLCDQYGLVFRESATSEMEANLRLENVQIARLAEEEIAAAVVEKSDDLPSGLVEEFNSASELEKLQILDRLGREGRLKSSEIQAFSRVEFGDLVNFAVKVCQRQIEMVNDRAHSPISLLKDYLKIDKPDFVGISAAMALVSGRSARISAELLLETGWKTWPEVTLPFVLGYVRKTGNPEFSRQITQYLQSPDPVIKYFAIDCLDAINPEDLRPQLAALLAEPDLNLHLRAVRALAKWDKPEALNFFAAALGSNRPGEAAAALAGGTFYDFSDISSTLIEFVSRSDDQKLIESACRLILINPDRGILKSLFLIAERSKGQKRVLLEKIVAQLADAVCACGLAKCSPAALKQDLADELNRIRQKEAELAKMASSSRQEALDTLEKWAFSKNHSERMLAVSSLRLIDFASVRPLLLSMLEKESDNRVFAGLSEFVLENLDQTLLEDVCERLVDGKDNLLAALFKKAVLNYASRVGIDEVLLLGAINEAVRSRKCKAADPPDYSIKRVRKIREEKSLPAKSIDLKPEHKIILAAVPLVILAFAVVFNLMFKTGKSSSGKIEAPSRPVSHDAQRFNRWKDKLETGQERIIFGRVILRTDKQLVVNSTVLKKTIYVDYATQAPPLSENSHFSGKVRIESMNSEKIRATYLSDK
ncbi:MAG: HEAT repeat domain-containing protein [Candidatus Rifleibacteriota bacterium]